MRGNSYSALPQNSVLSRSNGFSHPWSVFLDKVTTEIPIHVRMRVPLTGITKNGDISGRITEIIIFWGKLPQFILDFRYRDLMET